MSDRYEALRVVRYNLAHGGLSVADDGYLVSYDYYAITEARLKRVIEERDDTVKEWNKIKAERDALAAQVERLNTACAMWEQRYEAVKGTRDALAAQVEALKALVPDASAPGKPHPISIYGGEPTGSRPR